ncbi:MAG: SLBB domain-containing protein [Bacteriovorax sp.]|nr:SLBB domain-containing protein [Bacteriovorax sp.]
MKKNIILVVLICEMLYSSLIFADDSKVSTGAFKDFSLPSEFEGIKKEAGALYYSASSKGKVLIPVNVWGEVNKTGLHFVPIDTDLVQGLSLAGGPKSTAALDKIKLTRNVDGKIEEFKFDLEKGGTVAAYNYKLTPGDTIFVEREYFYENRTYYTSLLAVVATILSSVILYRQIKRGQ